MVLSDDSIRLKAVNHLTYAVKDKERALRFWPNKQLLAAGALLAGGSDWPVMPNPDPWNGI